MKKILHSFLLWLSFIPFAIGNGMFREAILVPYIGGYALPVSGILFIAYIFAVTYIFIPKMHLQQKQQAVLIGVFWMCLTISFEFLFGWSIGKSTSMLIEGYDITTGNLWILIVLTMGITPWIMYTCKGKGKRSMSLR